VPPSCVDHSCAPYAQPSLAVANRRFETAASEPSDAVKVPAVDQVWPPSVVFATVVRLLPAVPSTKPSSADTKVTDAGWKPLNPPDPPAGGLDTAGGLTGAAVESAGGETAATDDAGADDAGADDAGTADEAGAELAGGALDAGLDDVLLDEQPATASAASAAVAVPRVANLVLINVGPPEAS
jgi:hypothetical protein